MNKDGLIRTFIAEIERSVDLQGRTLGFNIMRTGAGGYRTVTGRIDRDHMPPFEGKSTWAEIQKIAAKPWAFYKVTRLVEPPSH